MLESYDDFPKVHNTFLGPIVMRLTPVFLAILHSEEQCCDVGQCSEQMSGDSGVVSRRAGAWLS